MQFIDLGRQYESVKDAIDQAIRDVVENQHFIMGPQVKELEEKLAAYVGRKYCLTCSSGTSALYLPLVAYGLQPNDAVFVSLPQPKPFVLQGLRRSLLIRMTPI